MFLRLFLLVIFSKDFACKYNQNTFEMSGKYFTLWDRLGSHNTPCQGHRSVCLRVCQFGRFLVLGAIQPQGWGFGRCLAGGNWNF